ncbi:CsgG/HfaB family protein [Limisalsivibrio acetivorans]|uniref:CsgG/HfaB family protein n=1 Tax=Limisalsivibrio acetivorans TaxID=1304888 RepID=UPI0003B7813A|nr:CsgG/HfaB family protein [Limisalsivibrio acetivorans]
MKRLFIVFAALLLVACGGKSKIDKVNYSKNFSAAVVNRVAIIDFSKTDGHNYDVSNITSKFTAELVGSELFTLVDRNDVDKIMKEVGYQFKGAEIGTLTQETVQKLKQVGADTILTGKLISFKQNGVGDFKTYSEAHLTAKLIRIETGEILWSAEMLRSSRGKLGGSEADYAEQLLSEIVTKMSVPLKTESTFRRIIRR